MKSDMYNFIQEQMLLDDIRINDGYRQSTLLEFGFEVKHVKSK